MASFFGMDGQDVHRLGQSEVGWGDLGTVSLGPLLAWAEMQGSSFQLENCKQEKAPSVT